MASLKIPEEQPRLTGILRYVLTGEPLVNVLGCKLDMRLRVKSSSSVECSLARLDMLSRDHVEDGTYVSGSRVWNNADIVFSVSNYEANVTQQLGILISCIVTVPDSGKSQLGNGQKEWTSTSLEGAKGVRI
jgi:hypothetical protein